MSWVDLRARVPQARFGAMVGLAQGTVSDLIARGVLERDGRVGDWLLSYTAHLRGIAAGRDDTSPLATERHRLTRAKAVMAEQEARRRAGALVEVAAVEREYGRALRIARDAILAVPPRTAPVLAAETDAATVDALLRRELVQALEAAVVAIGARAADRGDATDG